VTRSVAWGKADCLLNNGRGGLVTGYSWMESAPNYVRPFRRCVRVVNLQWLDLINVALQASASVSMHWLMQLMSPIIDRPRPPPVHVLSHRSIRSTSWRSRNHRQHSASFRFIISTGGGGQRRYGPSARGRLTWCVVPMCRREYAQTSMSDAPRPALNRAVNAPARLMGDGLAVANRDQLIDLLVASWLDRKLQVGATSRCEPVFDRRWRRIKSHK